MSDDAPKPGANTDKRLANLRPAWPKGGPSPNPSGRPPDKKFKRKNRQAAWKLIEAIVARRLDEQTTVEELTKAYIAAASFGGFITEAERLNLAVKALGYEHLNAEQKSKLIDQMKGLPEKEESDGE